MELGNLLRLTYGANVILGAYTTTNTKKDSPEGLDDESQSVIQYLLHGKMADGLQDASYASEAVSMAQMFADKAAIIKDKFARMQELAEQAAETNGKPKKLEQMQEEFEQLAAEINEIVNSTEYNGNKLFTGKGSTISISIGNNSTIDIFAKDLSIDIEGLDLTTDAEAALIAIQSKVSQSNYYSGYLEDQAEHLQSAIQLIEFEKYNDLGIEADKFNMELAEQIAAYASTKTLEELSALFDIQANIEPDRALQLLQEKIEEYQEQEQSEE